MNITFVTKVCNCPMTLVTFVTKVIQGIKSELIKGFSRPTTEKSITAYNRDHYSHQLFRENN